MTLQPDPTLFLAHCKAHKALAQSQPCKELKVPTHNPPTPADGILIRSIFNTQQHLYFQHIYARLVSFIN